MKKLKRDIDIYNTIDVTPKIEAKSSGQVNRGTRNLMKDIQSELNGDESIEETDFDSENQENL